MKFNRITHHNNVQKENTVMKEKINEIKKVEDESSSSNQISQMFDL